LAGAQIATEAIRELLKSVMWPTRPVENLPILSHDLSPIRSKRRFRPRAVIPTRRRLLQRCASARRPPACLPSYSIHGPCGLGTARRRARRSHAASKLNGAPRSMSFPKICFLQTPEGPRRDGKRARHRMGSSGGTHPRGGIWSSLTWLRQDFLPRRRA